MQYASSSDGVSIAHWSFGGGDPIIYMAGGPWAHIDLWEVPECQEWYGRLSEKSIIVRYDVRGTGLSEREVSDLSLEAGVSDLEAVAAQLPTTLNTLFAAADAGPVAIAYAVCLLCLVCRTIRKL